MSAQQWTAQEWIDRLNSLGVWVGMLSGRLALKPADKIPSEWIPALKAAKPNLIAFLTQAGSGCSAPLSVSDVSLEASGPAGDFRTLPAPSRPTGGPWEASNSLPEASQELPEASAYPNSPAEACLPSGEPAEAETPTEADTRPAASPTEAEAYTNSPTEAPASRFDMDRFLPEVRPILQEFASGMGEDLLAVSPVGCSWSDCQFPATVLIRTFREQGGQKRTVLVWGCPRCGRVYQPKILSANAMARALEALEGRPQKAASASKPICPCGSTRYVDTPIHNGRSLRRNCQQCGRFLGFPRWYGQRQEDCRPDPTAKEEAHFEAEGPIQ